MRPVTLQSQVPPLWMARPLLHVSKGRLLATCAHRGLWFANDPSNLDEAYDRIKIRHVSPLVCMQYSPNRLIQHPAVASRPWRHTTQTTGVWIERPWQDCCSIVNMYVVRACCNQQITTVLTLTQVAHITACQRPAASSYSITLPLALAPACHSTQLTRPRSTERHVVEACVQWHCVDGYASINLLQLLQTNAALEIVEAGTRHHAGIALCCSCCSSRSTCT